MLAFGLFWTHFSRNVCSLGVVGGGGGGEMDIFVSVESPNKGHFGATHFVFRREATVVFSEVDPHLVISPNLPCKTTQTHPTHS